MAARSSRRALAASTSRPTERDRESERARSCPDRRRRSGGRPDQQLRSRLFGRSPLLKQRGAQRERGRRQSRAASAGQPQSLRRGTGALPVAGAGAQRLPRPAAPRPRFCGFGAAPHSMPGQSPAPQRRPGPGRNLPLADRRGQRERLRSPLAPKACVPILIGGSLEGFAREEDRSGDQALQAR